MSTAVLTSESQQRSAAQSQARDGRAFRAVRIVLGLLLVTATGLKLYGLNVMALPRAGWFGMPQVQVAAAEWELALGDWLLLSVMAHVSLRCSETLVDNVDYRGSMPANWHLNAAVRLLRPGTGIRR